MDVIKSNSTNLHSNNKMQSLSPIKMLQSVCNSQLELQIRNNVKWSGSIFESIHKLSPDYSGKVGELLFNQACDAAGMKVSYLGDSNIDAEDGTYDSKVCNICEKKDEIKTAWQGSNGSFQHESLRAGGCDQHVFVDVAPNYYYITVLATFDMTQRHPVIGRKPHLRRGTTNVYKFDFGESNLKKSIDAGLTIKVDESTSMEQVAEFIKKFH
jgi:hypothetical protein